MSFYFFNSFPDGTVAGPFDPIIVAVLDIFVRFLVETLQGCVTDGLSFRRVRRTVYKVIESLMIRTIAVILHQIGWFLYQENYPDVAIEKGSIDEVITMMIKGEAI